MPLRGRGGPGRREHECQPGRAHGHERAARAGQASRGQPGRDQRPPRAHDGRQGQLHPPHRLGSRKGPRGRPGDELVVRARDRRTRHTRGGPPRARRSRHRHRPRARRRHPCPLRAVRDGGRHPRLRGLPPRLRGPRAQGAHEQALGRRLRRRDGHAHQPGRPRHRPSRYPVSCPARAPSSVSERSAIPPSSPPATREVLAELGRRQGGHAHLHLRPPHHPRGPVGAVPRLRARGSGRRARLLRRDLLLS